MCEIPKGDLASDLFAGVLVKDAQEHLNRARITIAQGVPEQAHVHIKEAGRMLGVEDLDGFVRVQELRYHPETCHLLTSAISRSSDNQP